MDIINKIKEDLCKEANLIKRNESLLLGTAPGEPYTVKDFDFYDLCKAPNREKLNPEFFTAYYNHESGKIKDFDLDYLKFLNNFQNRSPMCWQRYVLINDEGGKYSAQKIPYKDVITMVSYWGTLYEKSFNSLSEWFEHNVDGMEIKDIDSIRVLVYILSKKLLEVEHE